MLRIHKAGRYNHQCPSCGAFIRWALTYCFDCGESKGGNPAWMSNVRKHEARARSKRPWVDAGGGSASD